MSASSCGIVRRIGKETGVRGQLQRDDVSEHPEGMLEHLPEHPEGMLANTPDP